MAKSGSVGSAASTGSIWRARARIPVARLQDLEDDRLNTFGGMILPGALAYVARYFQRHPEVDVVYGHRVLIDEADREMYDAKRRHKSA